MLQWITDFTHKLENQAGESSIVYHLASKYYLDVIKKETILANITDKDHILCIGSGTCPFSAILFHQITGAKVTAIDNNPICIPDARQIIDRLSIADFVHVFCQDGSSAELIFTEYSVIHFALQIQPIEIVFSQVEKKIAPGTKLLIRRPRKNLDQIYSQLSSPILALSPYTTHSKARNIGSTLLYIK